MSYSICCDSWHQRLTYHIRLLVGTTPMWLFSNNRWIDLNVFNIPENFYFEFSDIISDASFYFSHTSHIFSDYMACFTLTLAEFLVHCWLQMIINPIFMAACRVMNTWIYSFLNQVYCSLKKPSSKMWDNKLKVISSELTISINCWRS